MGKCAPFTFVLAMSGAVRICCPESLMGLAGGKGGEGIGGHGAGQGAREDQTVNSRYFEPGFFQI